jgi:Flp pilus assembly protein TadG
VDVAASPVGRRGRSGPADRGCRRPDRGTAAVEAAFVLPILLLIVFGIIDFGRMANAQINVTEAAREGARVAAFGGNPRDRVSTIAGADAEVTTVACPADITDEDAEVTVTYPFEFVTPVGAFVGLFTGTDLGGDLTLRGRGIMPCQ